MQGKGLSCCTIDLVPQSTPFPIPPLQWFPEDYQGWLQSTKPRITSEHNRVWPPNPKFPIPAPPPPNLEGQRCFCFVLFCFWGMEGSPHWFQGLWFNGRVRKYGAAQGHTGYRQKSFNQVAARIDLGTSCTQSTQSSLWAMFLPPKVFCTTPRRTQLLPLPAQCQGTMWCQELNPGLLRTKHVLQTFAISPYFQKFFFLKCNT